MTTENSTSRHEDELLISYLSGSATFSEREEALAWIGENPDHRRYFEELKDYYHFTRVTRKPSGFSREAGWNRVMAQAYRQLYEKEKENIEPARIRLIRNLIYLSAASVILAFLVGNFTGFFDRSEKQVAVYRVFHEVNVPLGSKSQLTLPDGTKIWLNAGSSLRYPVNFINGPREVYLEGEAYFDVTRDKSNPFYVKTTEISIRVLGTTFNVKSYREDKTIEATLVSGSIEIETFREKDGSKETIKLAPNQRITLSKDDRRWSVLENLSESHPGLLKPLPVKSILIEKKINPESEIAWKDKRLVFSNERFDNIIVKMERWYDVKINLADEQLKEYRYTGTFQDETIEQALEALRLATSFKYTINKNEIKIYN